MSQVILNRKKSTRSGPNIWYTVTVEQSERTLDSVTLKFTVESDLEFDSSNKGVGYTMTGGVYIDGTWHSIVLKGTNVTWQGSNDPYTASGTFTISGLDVSQTSITGIKFRVVSSLPTQYNGGTLDATSCSDIIIDRCGGIVHINVDGEWKGAIPWVNVDGEWKPAVPWANVDGTWKMSS